MLREPSKIKVQVTQTTGVGGGVCLWADTLYLQLSPEPQEATITPDEPEDLDDEIMALARRVNCDLSLSEADCSDMIRTIMKLKEQQAISANNIKLDVQKDSLEYIPIWRQVWTSSQRLC